MKRKLTIIFSVLALVLVAAVAFGVRGGGFSRILADILQDVPGKVDVFAKNNQNSPLEGVNVETSLDNNSYFLVGMTDQTGHLIFNEPDIANRTRYFRVNLPMHSTSPEVIQVSIAKNTTKNANFTLTPISGVGSVSGKITVYNPGGADNGNPLPSATVRIINSTGSEKGRTTSATDGRYQINSIPEGTGYAVYASKAGYEQNSRQGVNIIANQTVQNQDIGLTPSSGAQPSPSPRASPSASPSPNIPKKDKVDLMVRVYSSSDNRNISGIPTILDIATDKEVERITNSEQYNATFKDLAAGQHSLSVNLSSHPNYNSKYEYKFIAALEVKNTDPNVTSAQNGKQYLEIGLGPKSALELLTVIGRITDEGGQPISGAEITVSCIDNDPCGIKPATGTSTDRFNKIDNNPNYEYNYLIRNIYNAPQMNGKSLKVTVKKEGFILDTNNNGESDFDEGLQFYISSGETLKFIASLQSGIAVKSFVLKEIPAYKFSIAGKVTLKQTGELVGGIVVSLLSIVALDISKDHLLSQKLGGQKFANYMIEDVRRPTYFTEFEITASSQGGFEFMGDSSPFGCNFNYSPKKILKVGEDIQFNQELGIWLGIVNIEIDCGDKYTVLVKDSSNKDPISGAAVEISDPGLNFNLSATTDAQGKAYLDPGKIFAYCKATGEKGKQKDLFGVSIKISAQGYISRIIFSGSSICLSETNEYLLDKASSAGGEAAILGKVVEKDRLFRINPVKGAKINLYNFPPAGAPIKSATSDNQGKFELKPLDSKKYIVSAYHPKYAEIEHNRLVVDLKPGERVYIELLLGKVEEGETFSVLVLRSRSLMPIQGVKVKLKEPAKPEEREETTGSFRGAIFYDVWVGQEIEINLEVTKKGGGIVRIGRTIKIPKNWNDLSFDEQRKILSKFIFIVDDGKNNAVPESEVIFKVKDRRTGQPLADATVYVSLRRVAEELRYPPDPFNPFPPVETDFKSVSFRAVTNSSGEAIFPRDFSLFDPQGLLKHFDPSEKNNPSQYRVLKGEGITYLVEKDGYKEVFSIKRVGLLRKIIEVELDNLAERRALLAVCLVDFLSANLSPKEPIDGRNIRLERKKGDNYIEVATADLADKNGPCYYFRNRRAGDYRARVVIPNLPPSETVHFSGREDKEILYKLCSIAADASLEKFSDDIYFSLQGNEAKKLYEDNKNEFERLGRLIEFLGGHSRKLKPVVIAVGEYGSINARAVTIEAGSCAGLDNPKIIYVAKELITYLINHQRTDVIETTVAHEYGHYLYSDLEKNSRRFIRKWNWLFEQVRGQDSNLQECILGAIKDGNVNIAPHAFGGHPWDDPSEMFASFYSAFFTQHNRLYDIINSNLIPNSPCQNILKYMWQLFAENVGKVYPDDDKVFAPIGGKIGKANYTWKQIIEGKWMGNNYNRLSLNQKVSVQFQRLVSPSFSSLTLLRQSLGNFQTWLDSLLSQSGIRNTGRLKGMLRAEDGSRLANTVIMIGPRAVLTDSQGRFFSKSVPAGQQPIIVKKDAKDNYKVVSPDPPKLTVIKGTTRSLDIIIKR